MMMIIKNFAFIYYLAVKALVQTLGFHKTRHS